MGELTAAYAYLVENSERFWEALLRHLLLSGVALAVAVALCVPLGIFISRRVRLAQGVITAVGSLRLIPSLAILFLALPYLGLGLRPALFALTLLALPPVLINTYAGIRNLDAAVIEAARGVGMSQRQMLRRVELPLALPAILTGIRIAAVEVIASATLASFINGGGLGEFVQIGFALNRTSIMLVGALPVALLALAADTLIGQIQRRSTVGM
ncbi:MAG: ABC transporter permease [Roseiflexaceae bacterium]|nr:ABC transporter permease [Roseiflexaceae bacterium]